MTKIYNKPKMKYFRRLLRKTMTESEKKLWKHIRKGNLGGFRFLRQYLVNNYILDFYCPAKKLAIELDGSQHITNISISENDKIRTNYLESIGIKVLRFQNNEIKTNIYLVMKHIFFELNH